IPYIAPGRERVSKAGLLIIALCVAVIIYCFAQAYRTSGERVARRAVIESYLDGINSAQKAVIPAFDPSLNRASAQERESVAAQLAKAIEKLQNAQAPDAEADQIRQGLLRITRRQHSLLTSPATDMNNDEIKANSSDYKKVWNQLEDWVETE